MSSDAEKGGQRLAHNRRQVAVFDQVAPGFDRPLPEDVARRTAAIVAEAEVPAGAAVLDVGTGTGVLLPYLLGRRPSRIVACDLSQEMLARARRKFGRSVAFLRIDVSDLPAQAGPFDFVFCNAVYANFYDERLTLTAINELLRAAGLLIISHPMGRAYVADLRRNSPDLVLRELPTQAEAKALLRECGFRLLKFRDEPDFYLALAKKVKSSDWLKFGGVGV